MNRTFSSYLGCFFLASSCACSINVIAQSGGPISGAASPALAGGRTTVTNSNSSPSLTNSAPAEVILTFEQLAGYPLKLTDNLVLNTNRAAWADSQVNAMIPENIRKLDGHRVFIEGFMLPVAYEQDRLSEFMLVRDMPGCCYGYPPNPHEWVAGVVKSPKIKAEVEHPVRLGGIFHVGAERHGGYLGSIYRLDADTTAEYRGK